MFDLRILTGPCLLIVGGFFLAMAWRLWRVHPINRAIRLGPYVTVEGMRAVLGLRMLLFSYGAFFTAMALANIAFWYVRTAVNDPLIQFLGSLAAGLGIWAAIYTVATALRWLRSQ